MIVAWWQVHNPPDCPRLLGEATHQVLLSSIKINGWSCLQSSRLGNARGAHSAADRHWQLPRQIWSSLSRNASSVITGSGTTWYHNGRKAKHFIMEPVYWATSFGNNHLAERVASELDHGGRCWNQGNVCYLCLKFCSTIQSDDHKFLGYTRCHQQLF